MADFWAGFDLHDEAAEGNDGAAPADGGDSQLQWALDVLEKHEANAARAIQRAYRTQ